MTITSRELHATRARGRATPPRSMTLVAYAVTCVFAALAIYALVSTIVSWGQIWMDDLNYGRPRTTHLHGFVGRQEEANGQPTHFVAINLQRQVVVLELPGGDANKVRSLPGPYLFGANEELTPILLALHDVDGDNQGDLLITVRNEQVIYLNRDGAFRMPTPEEQSQLVSWMQ